MQFFDVVDFHDMTTYIDMLFTETNPSKLYVDIYITFTESHSDPLTITTYFKRSLL